MYLCLVVFLLVEITVDRVGAAQIAEDVEQVYAHLFAELEGLVVGVLGAQRGGSRVVGIWLFETVEQLRQAEEVIAGTRAGMTATLGASFSPTEFDVTAVAIGPAAARILGQSSDPDSHEDAGPGHDRTKPGVPRGA